MPVEAVLEGRVLLGDSLLQSGTVVLHRLNDLAQGEVDSTTVAADGTFSLRLPQLPDPTVNDFYFASVRHDGVMYFGGPINSAVQLDSTYQIQAYDTLLAPMEGVSIALEARSLFLEQTGTSWRITDLFALRSDHDRTVVPREGGRTWSYPLPAGARDVAAEQEMSGDVATYEDGSLVVRAALPPGERMFIVSYVLDDLEGPIPTPGETEMFDLLVIEPAPPLEVDGLAPIQSVELEPGQTARRYSAENLALAQLNLSVGEMVEPPPVEWIAVILALVLAAGGLVALRGSGERRAAAAQVVGRQAILVELASLDEDFERSERPSKNARRKYQRRREELMRRLRSED